MAGYLTPEQYQDLLKEVEQGQSSLGVSRNLARQFFSNVGHRNIRDMTGISMRGRKTTVVALLFFALGLAALCLGLIAETFLLQLIHTTYNANDMLCEQIELEQHAA
ncbi:MAG: hypothetical protein JJ934_01235 [Pseudomonadales bacterium]|nr:hypothetical protein [Pseudomonadales bacterium]MBO6563246.1 hypothetical protein [Pseudomonadales bacterium]MBO6594583.1 hypothetical protein [Pseudomonadales bacterium]MBO6655482.1 hypothetical protein [Pseudomonadales bacterium]MBO6701086.1 hypothetical protein [Pseudomonadales bacterium]